MSGQILCDVLPLPKRHIIGRLYDSRTELLRMVEMPIDILNMYMDVLVDFIGMRRTILASRCSHHDRALTDRELSVHHCAIGSSGSQTLDKPERSMEPRNRLCDVLVDQDGHDCRLRRGAVHYWWLLLWFCVGHIPPTIGQLISLAPRDWDSLVLLCYKC